MGFDPDQGFVSWSLYMEVCHLYDIDKQAHVNIIADKVATSDKGETKLSTSHCWVFIRH